MEQSHLEYIKYVHACVCKYIYKQMKSTFLVVNVVYTFIYNIGTGPTPRPPLSPPGSYSLRSECIHTHIHIHTYIYTYIHTHTLPKHPTECPTTITKLTKNKTDRRAPRRRRRPAARLRLRRPACADHPLSEPAGRGQDVRAREPVGVRIYMYVSTVS
jgi:hypothetical protein